jgi:hypothetical protein
LVTMVIPPCFAADTLPINEASLHETRYLSTH